MMMPLGPRLHCFFRPARAALLAAAFLAGCGGGVDSGGTGAPMTAFASGAISGFGSVIVAGIHFDDRSAAVADADGSARSRDDLRLGMTVEARGSAIAKDADGNDASTATSIVVRSEMIGPVGASDLAARTLTVLGQTIDISASTVFDEALPGGQAALALGDVVEVYASVDVATGHYRATRVERRAGVVAFVLRGIVAGLDTTARTFSIGATRIAYAGVAAAPTLANGSFVRVALAVAPGAGGVWSAIAIGDRTPALDDRDEAKLEGLVSAFASTAQFSVDGTPVDARAAQFPDGTAGLALGKRVEVEGATAKGVLVATRVRLVSDSQDSGREFDVRGTIVSLDVAGKTFVVRNVVVGYSGTVDFRGGTALDLALGVEVEARGLLAGGGTRLQATRIDFRR
ncbi:MAG TPA: DUF5666 domain-containing protein [Caldimonas sp.]|nr:DUF5666 domain-containing protein [Caldimonas sp.]